VDLGAAGVVDTLLGPEGTHVAPPDGVGASRVSGVGCCSPGPHHIKPLRSSSPVVGGGGRGLVVVMVWGLVVV
jgi:hypothetical protein